MASAQDLNRYADYLEQLYAAVQKEHAGEERAIADIDLSSWKRSILPSFHHHQIIWATAKNNIRWAYRLANSPAAQQLLPTRSERQEAAQIAAWVAHKDIRYDARTK